MGRCACFFVLLLLMGAAVSQVNVARAADTTELLQLQPSHGGPGTTVEVSMNVKWDLEEHEIPVEGYYGLRYALLWDPLGPWNTESVGNLLSQTTWDIIGWATVESDGFLRGTLRIPDDPWPASGEHYIFAVYEHNSGAESKAWWWARFNLEEEPETESYMLSVSLVPAEGGSVYKYPNKLTYDHGETVTLTAYPSSGWEFKGWGGDAYGNDDSTDVYMTRYMSVTAYFEKTDPSPCIIATATYGGPLAAEVVFMRNVRDNMIGSNYVGQVLVEGWNSFYYSWSPSVARLISDSNELRSVFSVFLSPLLGLMHIVELQYNLLAGVSAELASVVSFFTAAISASAIYVAFPVWALFRLMKNKKRVTQFLQGK